MLWAAGRLEMSQKVIYGGPEVLLVGCGRSFLDEAV